MRFPHRFLVRSLVAVAVPALVGACGGSGATAPVPPPVPPGMVCTPGNGTVCLTTSNTFNPSSMTVTPGTTVTWDNETGVTHNVTFDTPGSPASIGNFASGAKTATFPKAGTYDYHCTIHGASMSGKIVVQ